MNQKKELIKNTIIIAIGKLSTQIVSFLLLPLYTSKLSTQEYGIYDFLVTLSVFLLPVITLLMEESMFRFLIDAENERTKKKVITQTILFCILQTIIFSIIAFLVVYIIKYEYGILFILFVVSNILIALSNALSRGVGKIKLYSLSNFILGASTIILNVFFILVLKSGAKGLLWANTIANSVTALFIFFKLKITKYISIKNVDRKMLKEMVSYSIPLVPNGLSWAVITLSDRLVITTFIGTSANGIYSIANRFPNILNTVYGFFYTAWKESATKIIKEDNKEKYYNTIYKDMKKFLFAVVICLIAGMPFIFNILIDQSFKEAYIYIPLLVLSIYYSNLSSFYGGIFSAFKETKIMGVTTVIAAVLNILINVGLIYFIGLHAAVISTFLSNFIIFYYRRKALKRYIKLRETKIIGPFIMIVIVFSCYYSQNVILQIISVILAILYSMLINKNLLLMIKNKLRI